MLTRISITVTCRHSRLDSVPPEELSAAEGSKAQREQVSPGAPCVLVAEVSVMKTETLSLPVSGSCSSEGQNKFRSSSSPRGSSGLKTMSELDKAGAKLWKRGDGKGLLIRRQKEN